MDSGLWTLKCQNCGKTFTLEVKSGERILTVVKEKACPHCQVRPADIKGDKAVRSWHQVLDFQLPQKKPD